MSSSDSAVSDNATPQGTEETKTEETKTETKTENAVASEETKGKDSGAKRKSPAKKKEAPVLERRRSARIEAKPKEQSKHDDDDDEDFEEDDSDDEPKKKKKTPTKKKSKKASPAKKGKNGTEDSEIPPPSSSLTTQNEDDSTFVHPSQATQPLSQPQSLDGLGVLTDNYVDLQSQDFSFNTYQRNKDYYQPLGNLTSNQIKEGEEVLNKIKEMMEKKEKDETKFVNLSNQFYTIIPSQDETKLPLINNETILNEKITLIKALGASKAK